MRFRTEIEPLHGSFEIGADDSIVLIGSCFADEIGRQLELDGIKSIAGIMGPLFNPSSIKSIIDRIGKPYNLSDLTEHNGIWHCLDWANRYQNSNPDELLKVINADFSRFSDAFDKATTIIITFGNTKVYETEKGVVGNCHKLPREVFNEHRLTLDEIVDSWSAVKLDDKRVILTLSPVRYVENGLSESTLAKATLRVAIDKICNKNGWDYFPAYEILNDDLRDYRFYAQDLKHPSETAVSYIYEKFCDAYMSASTRDRLRLSRKENLAKAHRQIISTL